MILNSNERQNGGNYFAEYNEFMKAYNHSYRKDGIYHFEDWPDDYK